MKNAVLINCVMAAFFYGLKSKIVEMKKITPGNIFFGIFILLLIIPTTRSFIQINLQKVLTKVIPANTIDESEQKTLSTYNVNFKGINTSNLALNSTKGKVIFINFWATWCPPCIAEMPDLQTLQNKYKNEITFVFVTNESQKKVNLFLEENNLTLPVYQLSSQLPKELKYRSIPTTFIIDKKGTIVLHKTGVANWNSNNFYETLNELIKN